MAKLKDERIIKESNAIIAPLYSVIVILSVAIIIIKYLIFTPELIYYYLEVIAVCVSILYLIIRTLISHIPLITSKDSCIKELQNKYRMHSFNICYLTYVIGEFILLAFFNAKIEIISLYFLIVLPPNIIISYKLIKNGLLIWGTKRKEKTGLKSLKKQVVITSLLFGITMEWLSVWGNSSFQPIDLLWVLGRALPFGILYYIMMKHMINKAEKNADIEVENAENQYKL